MLRRVSSLLALGALGVACGHAADDGTTSSIAQASAAAEPEGTVAAPLGATGLVPVWAVLPSPPALSEFAVHARRDRAAAIARVRARIAEIDREQAALVPRLEAAGATVVARLRKTANAIQLLAPPHAVLAIRRLDGVARVERVAVHRRLEAATATFVGAPAAWGRATAADGSGVRIGIVDTGIDYDHAAFGGGGKDAYDANDPSKIESGSFPTAKVVGGWDFVGDAFDPSQHPSPSPDADPRDCAGHGTAVASVAAGFGVTTGGGTFAGPWNQSIDASAFRIGPGVAPKAELYALKVFGCTGETTQVDVAFEWAADPDDDGDPSDRLDVVNASLGTDFGFDQGTTEATVIHHLTEAGSLVVAAAGNADDVFYVASSPAIESDVLAVAALNPVASAVTLRIDEPAALAQSLPIVESDVGVPLATSGPVTGPLVYADPHDACGPLANAAQANGAILLVDRGTCPFVSKLDRAKAAGAKGVVIANNQPGAPPFAIGGGGQSYGFAAGMISRQSGDLLEAHVGESLVVTLDPTVLPIAAGGGVAGFSSRGPSIVDDRVKPDIAGPGARVTVAAVGSGDDVAVEDGTSFASPAIAGAAALVRQSHPALDPARVKALLMNTATPVVEDSGAIAPVSMVGAGRARADEAVARSVLATVAARPADVSVSFGAIIADQAVTRTAEIVVQNDGPAAVTFAASAAPTYAQTGVTATVSPPEVTVAAGGTANVVLTLAVAPDQLPPAAPDPFTPATIDDNGAPAGRQFLVEAAGLVKLDDTNGGAESLVVPYHAIVRAAAQLAAGTPIRCDPAASSASEITVPVEGTSAHPHPLVTAFELGATSPDKHLADPARAAADLLAAGIATDLPRAKTFEEARVFFGIAVAGEWTTPGRSIGGQTLAGYSGSTVTVAVDTNLDGAEDVTIEVESGRRQGPPYSDVMTARVNVTKTGEQRDALYVDMLPSDRLEALPLHNSVIVLPALLSSLGVAAESPAFAWSVRTHAPDGQTVDRIGWLRYDPSRPALDTARGFEGLPAFTGLAPVRVVADPTASADGELPHLLLLHHMNVAGKRTETVSLAGAKAGGDDDVALSLLAPKTLEAGAATTLEILVDNRGRFAAEGVRIDGAVEGATVRSTQPTRGTCGEANALPCSLGAIAPGGQARVRLTVVPTGGSPVRLRAQLTTEHACDAVADDDVLETAMPVVGSASPASLPDAAGGCGCRTAGAGAGGAKGAAALGLGALALVLSRRRRSR